MTRRGFALAGGAAVLGAALVAFGVKAARRSSAPDLPVAIAARTAFVRRVTAEGNLRAAKATPLVAPGNDLALKLAWIADDGAPARKGDVVVRFDPTETEKNLDRGKNERLQSVRRGEKSTVDSGAAVANLGRDASQAGLERRTAETFQSKDPDLFSRREILEADLDVSLAGERETKAVGTKVSREKVGRMDVELAGIDTRKADIKIRKAEAEMKALTIEAPHDGFVVFQRDWRGDLPSIGQQMWSGFKVAEIPDVSSIVADVWVLEADAGGLAAGQAATVVVESDPGHPYEARVERIDSVPKPRVRGSPVTYFGAVVKLEGTEGRPLKPGQRVTVTFRMDERPDALVVPRPALQVRDGKKVVWVRKRDAFVPVEVVAGPLAPALAVIEKGLEPGDVVALVDPEKRPVEASPKEKGGPALPAGGRS